MRACIILLILGWAGLSAGSALGQSHRTISPEQMVRMTLDEHGMLRAVRFEAAAAESAAEQARSEWWPNLSGRASYMHLSENIPPIGGQLPGIDSTFTLAPIERDRYHAEISLEQPLFTGFRILQQVRAAEHRAEAARAEIRQQRAGTAFEARESYWSLFSALRRRQAVAASLDYINVHLQDIRNRYESGTVLKRELLAARARRSEIRLDSVEAANDVRLARLELNRLAGLPDQTRVVPEEPAIDVDSREAPLRQGIADTLEGHPDMVAGREQLEALEARVRQTRTQWIPRVALQGRYVYARPNQYFFAEQDEFHGTWEAGVSLQWDLWDGGRRRAETSQASAELQAARARLEHREDEITARLERAYVELQGARTAVEVARRVVEQAREAFRVARQQFQAGSALSSDVLEAEVALRSAQTRRAEALAGWAIARAAIMDARGRVW